MEFALDARMVEKRKRRERGRGKKMSGTTSGRRMKKSFRADCSSALRARRYRE